MNNKGYIAQKNHGHTFKIHYKMLNDDEKLIYKKIFDTIDSYDPTVSIITKISPDRLWAICFQVLNDNPTIFWVDKKITFTIMKDKIDINFNFVLSQDEIKSIKRKITAKVDEIYNTCAINCKSDYELELNVYNYLLNKIKYKNNDQKIEHTLVGPLLYNYGVCEGIANAFSYIMNVFGINCASISGTIKETAEPHAWNIISLDGKWYNVDLTHDLDSENDLRHTYFNIRDEDLYDNRKWDVLIPCNSIDYNYYNYNNMYFSDMDNLLKFIDYNLSLGNTKLDFYFKSKNNENDNIKIILAQINKKYSINSYKYLYKSNVYRIDLNIKSSFPKMIKAHLITKLNRHH